MRISANASLKFAVGALCTCRRSISSISGRVWILCLSVALLATLPGRALAAPVPDLEPNDSIATAQSLDPFFDLTFDPNIENAAGVNTSTTVPHVEVISPGDGTVTSDYYSFTVFAPTFVTIDIDCAETFFVPLPTCPVGFFDIDS